MLEEGLAGTGLESRWRLWSVMAVCVLDRLERFDGKGEPREQVLVLTHAFELPLSAS